MKVNVEVECSPEEARRFLGLPDVTRANDVYVDERTVDVHVGRLRKAIYRGRNPDPIRTVRGAGYSFDERFAATT